MVRRATGQQLRTFAQSRGVLIVLIVLCAFFLVGIGREVLRRYSLDQQFSDLDQRIAELEAQNTELTGRIAYFQSDTYREEQARLKLGFSQPGEEAVTVPSAGGGTQNRETEESEEPARTTTTSNFEQWITYFFSNDETS